MRTYFAAVFIALLCLTCKENQIKTGKGYSAMDSVMQLLFQKDEVSGNILIAENDTIVLNKSYGYANRGNRALLNDSSVFELASVSKQFTAAAIIMLQQKGLLKFEDTVAKYIPSLPYKDITVYQLLTHTSGLPEYEELFTAYWNKKKIAYNKDIIDVLVKAKKPLLFGAGTKMEYSNTGYALLGTIIENISGQPYNEYLMGHIFQPLNMKHTRVYNSRRSLKDTIANYAYGYVYNDSLGKYFIPDSLKEYDYVFYLDGIAGDGCVNSTVLDLLKWDHALRNNTLFDKETLELINTKAVLKNGDTAYMEDGDSSKSYYGFGVFIDDETVRGKVISHTGGWPGYSNYFRRELNTGRTVIILTNSFRDNVEANKGYDKIMGLLKK